MSLSRGWSIAKLTFSEESFRLLRELRRSPPSFRGVARKLDRRAYKLNRRKRLHKIRLLFALAILSRYPKLFLDFRGICFVTEAPDTVTRGLRRYLENRLVKGGLVEKRKVSFLLSKGNSPEITKLCHQGIIIARNFYLVPPGQVKPKPRNLYRLASARLALLAQEEGEESDLVRLFDLTGEARAWLDRSAELLEDMGDMKNLRHYLEFQLREQALVLRNLLRLMFKCGLKREETVKKLIDGLDSYTNMMLQHVDDGVRTIKESGSIVRQVFKDLPETFGLGVKSLIRSESLVREIDAHYFVECILCGFEMPFSIPLPREIACQLCNQKYHQAPTAQQTSYTLT